MPHRVNGPSSDQGEAASRERARPFAADFAAARFLGFRPGEWGRRGAGEDGMVVAGDAKALKITELFRVCHSYGHGAN